MVAQATQKVMPFAATKRDVRGLQQLGLEIRVCGNAETQTAVEPRRTLGLAGKGRSVGQDSAERSRHRGAKPPELRCAEREANLLVPSCLQQSSKNAGGVRENIP